MLFNQLYLFWQIEHEYTCFGTVFLLLFYRTVCIVQCFLSAKCFENLFATENLYSTSLVVGRTEEKIECVSLSSCGNSFMTSLDSTKFYVWKNHCTHKYISRECENRDLFIFILFASSQKNLFLSCLSRILLFQYLWELIYKMTWFKAKRFNERRLSFFPLCLIPSSSNWFLSFARSQCVCVYFNSNRCIGSE